MLCLAPFQSSSIRSSTALLRSNQAAVSGADPVAVLQLDIPFFLQVGTASGRRSEGHRLLITAGQEGTNAKQTCHVPSK